MELLAPNGKPSNLPPKQYHLVRTPAFKKWFGDWENSPETASKITDNNGEPLICFHGSNESFNEFSHKAIGSSNDMGFYGRGFYFTFQKEEKWMRFAIDEASYYGKIVKPYFIKALNPFIFGDLKKYKGVSINFQGTQSLVFLSNIAKKFPQLAEKITLDKKIYNGITKENEFTQVPISVLPDLIDKYSKDLKIIEVQDRGETKINGYLKSKTKEVFYDNTESGGTKGSYINFDTLSYGIDGNNKKESIEILLIEAALEKYDGIEVKYNPEGYMTRNPEITEEIKKNHDCIMQGETGDELVVFENNRMKLADGTNITFDSSNPDVRFNDGGGISWNDYKNSQFNEEEHKYLPSDYFKAFEVMRNIKNKYSVLLITKDGIEYRLYNNSQNIIGAFDGEDLIGYSDNSAVEVSPKYQKRGIGLNLITLIKERNPKHRFGNMTPQGFNLMGSYYDKKIANNHDVKFDLGGTTMRKPKISVLLAPNGNPSNLTPEQYKLVRTPEFKKWFGDWENSPETASKIIDENGEPLRVYHKTDYKFTVFDKEKLGSSSNWNTAYFGFYFSNIYERTSYGRLSIKCFLNIRNPYLIECEMYCDYDYDYKRFDESNFSKNDGIIIKTMKLGKDEKADKHFVAFEPTQIKLADGTNTEFNSNNPDIRYEDGGLTLDKMFIGDTYSGVQVRNIVSKYGSSEGTDMVEFSKERIKEEDKYVLDYVSIDKLLERDIDLRTFIDSEKEYNGLGYTPNAREITEPIILGDALYSSMSNVVIDGYHRILQSIINDKEKILAFVKIDKGHDYLLYEHGGQIKDLLSSKEVEDKLGRELHWWNDDVVFIGGQKYKKVYLRPEYKMVV